MTDSTPTPDPNSTPAASADSTVTTPTAPLSAPEKQAAPEQATNTEPAETGVFYGQN